MTSIQIGLTALLTLGGFLIGLFPSWEAAANALPTEETQPVFEVIKHRDIAYRIGPGADPIRHKLDLYIPKGAKNFPVLFFVHGGGWKSGNKGLYAAIGQTFAHLGIGTAVINYRLSPGVKHPAHIEDVAKAFAWTRTHIAEYGGDASRITVSGHSAGGHLVALLAMDPTYLAAEKLSPAAIRGVAAISGVYRITPGEELFEGVFDADPEACRQASPLSHVSGKLPPFLIAYAEREFAHLDEMAIDLNAALVKSGNASTLMRLKGRSHISIIAGAIEPADPLHRALRSFVTK